MTRSLPSGKMFDSIKNALDGCGASINEGGVFVISEGASTSATGLISHIISSGLANSNQICFVSLQHTWGHYCNVGSKLGVNLRQLSSDGKIRVIEALKLLSGALDEGIHTQEHPFAFIQGSSENPLKNLYTLIKQTLKPWIDNNEYFILIIDSVSFLLNLGVKTKDINIFINYCKNLTENANLNKKCAGALVVVTQSCEKDEDTTLLLNKIIHSAALHMSLESLSTGLSREVHGNLVVNSFCKKLPNLCIPEVQTFQYKMEDKNMKLFALGTASGVL